MGEKAPFWPPLKSMARSLLLSRRIGKEPCGNKLGRIGMGEVNNDWSNFILTAIQHYWNELALSVWPLAEQLFIKPRNLTDSLGTGLGTNPRGTRLSTEHRDISPGSGLFTHLVAVICAAPFWQKSEAVSHHNSWLTGLCAGNIIYLSYLTVLYGYTSLYS